VVLLSKDFCAGSFLILYPHSGQFFVPLVLPHQNELTEVVTKKRA
jgi:hypothetical protein